MSGLKRTDNVSVVGNPVRTRGCGVGREVARHRLGIGQPIPGREGEFALGRVPLGSFRRVVLSFGGLSCLAQTYSCISKTDLSIASYIVHKVILTTLCTLYYLLLFFFFRFL